MKKLIPSLFAVLMTLIGVAQGSFSNPRDMIKTFPYINPQLRPVHGMSEFGVVDARDVRTPVWVMIRPSKEMVTVLHDDFRRELYETAQQGELTYEFYAADSVSAQGEKLWERVGTIHLNRAILSRGVDQNLLFAHDTLASQVTGKTIEIPIPVTEASVP